MSGAVPSDPRPPYEPPSPSVLAWVREVCGATGVTRVRRLLGGLTADVDRLELACRDQSTDVVLRRWTDTSPWTDGLVEREAAALTALGPGPVPAPKLIASDPSGRRAGVRCLLMSALPGAVVLGPADAPDRVRRLAEAQSTVHAVPAVLGPRGADWFEPAADRSWIADHGLRRDALAAAATPAPADAVFAHGDFQPFNVLWHDGAVSGVVDWPNAATSSRGVDVGHCRLNLAVLASADAAEDYLHHYEAAAGVAVDRAGQLRALLGWDPGWRRSIPVQVAGRTRVDVAGMPDRVAETIRRTLS